PLLEVSTDKVDTEVPSPIAGILQEILVESDETAEVGAVLARVGSGQPAPAEAPATESAPAPEASATESAPAQEAPVAETPVAEESAQSEPSAAAPAAQQNEEAAPAASARVPEPAEAGGYVTPIVRKLA